MSTAKDKLLFIQFWINNAYFIGNFNYAREEDEHSVKKKIGMSNRGCFSQIFDFLVLQKICSKQNRLCKSS